MVKRYGGHELAQYKDGDYVLHYDYLLLQAALREALEGWDICTRDPYEGKMQRRISELRKLLGET